MRLDVAAQNWTHRKAYGNLIRTIMLIQELRPDDGCVERGTWPLLHLANALYRPIMREPPGKWMENFPTANAA